MLNKIQNPVIVISIIVIILISLSITYYLKISYNYEKSKHIYIEANKFENFYKSRKIFPILVDTRSSSEYNKNHLNNAINIPSEELLLLNNLDEIKNTLNAQKHNDWILFLYAKDDAKTIKLKEKIEELCENKFKTKSPNAIYYLKGGYGLLLNEDITDITKNSKQQTENKNM
jgi:rhodanese-related sulfurtransferase